jgi:hypothetical protein
MWRHECCTWQKLRRDHYTGNYILSLILHRISTPTPFPVPPHVHIDFVVPPPGCGQSVTKFWGWGTHRAQLNFPDDVSDDKYERGVPGGTLHLNSTGYLDHGRYEDLPPARENSHGRTGNRIRDLIASNQKLWPPSHEAGHTEMWSIK